MEEQSVVNQAQVPAHQSKNNNSLLAIILFLLLLLLVAAGIIIYLLLQSKTSERSQLSGKERAETPQETIIIPTLPTASPTATVKKIAYIKDRNIWIINSDGTEKKKITNNTDTQTGFLGVAWKNAKNVTYSLCKKGCELITQNIETGTEKSEANPGEFAGETYIGAFSWNHAGDTLALIYTFPDGKTRLAFRSGSLQSDVKEFKPALGRGGSFDDDVSIKFSPNDSKIVVTNTTTQPNKEGDKNTIWVFENDGREILNLEGNNQWATQATWIDNDNFVYKQGDALLKRAYYSPASTTLLSINEPFDSKVSPDDGQVAFWQNDREFKHPTIVIFDLSSQKKIEYQDAMRPVWLDQNTIIAIATKEGTEEGMGGIIIFEKAGLKIIDLKNNSQKQLDSGQITFFAIQ